MMTIDDERGEGGKKCSKFDDVICELIDDVNPQIFDLRSEASESARTRRQVCS